MMHTYQAQMLRQIYSTEFGSHHHVTLTEQ